MNQEAWMWFNLSSFSIKAAFMILQQVIRLHKLRLSCLHALHGNDNNKKRCLYTVALAGHQGGLICRCSSTKYCENLNEEYLNLIDIIFRCLDNSYNELSYLCFHLLPYTCNICIQKYYLLVNRKQYVIFL